MKKMVEPKGYEIGISAGGWNRAGYCFGMSHIVYNAEGWHVVTYTPQGDLEDVWTVNRAGAIAMLREPYGDWRAEPMVAIAEKARKMFYTLSDSVEPNKRVLTVVEDYVEGWGSDWFVAEGTMTFPARASFNEARDCFNRNFVARPDGGHVNVRFI